MRPQKNPQSRVWVTRTRFQIVIGCPKKRVDRTGESAVLLNSIPATGLPTELVPIRHLAQHLRWLLRKVPPYQTMMIRVDARRDFCIFAGGTYATTGKAACACMTICLIAPPIILGPAEYYPLLPSAIVHPAISLQDDATAEWTSEDRRKTLLKGVTNWSLELRTLRKRSTNSIPQQVSLAVLPNVEAEFLNWWSR